METLRKLRGRKHYLDGFGVFVHLLCFVSCVYLDILVIFLFYTQTFSAREGTGLLSPISYEIDHPDLYGKSLPFLTS